MTVEISRGDLHLLSVACLAYATQMQQDALQCKGAQRDNMVLRAQRWARASRIIRDTATSHPLYDRKEVIELGIEIK